MEKMILIKGYELLTKLEYLKKCQNVIVGDIEFKSVHFQMNSHYGELGKAVQFEPKYTEKFLKVVDEIIKELQDELDNL